MGRGDVFCVYEGEASAQARGGMVQDFVVRLRRRVANEVREIEDDRETRITEFVEQIERLIGGPDDVGGFGLEGECDAGVCRQLQRGPEGQSKVAMCLAGLVVRMRSPEVVGVPGARGQGEHRNAECRAGRGQNAEASDVLAPNQAVGVGDVTTTR